MNIQEFVNHFQGVKHSGDNQYNAKCPAHSDSRNSLSIGFSKEKNHILINCHAGCSAEDVLKSIGLSMKDLYSENTNNMGKPQVLNHKTYDYYDENGNLVYNKTRVDYSDGSKSFFFQQPNGIKKMSGVQRQLYNLSNVMSASTVYFVEGEKCADAIISKGRVATTLDTGAKSPWHSHYDKYLKDKKIIIIPDNDMAGFKYAKSILEHLPTAKVIKLPDVAEKGDIYDWLNMGHTMEEFDTLPFFNINEYLTDIEETAYDEDDIKSTVSKKTQAQVILNLVEANNTVLFRDSSNDLYAGITVDNHKEVWAIDSNDFYMWLNGLYYKHAKKPVKKDSLTQALAVLSAKAKFDCKETITLSNRVAKKDNCFWYDLSNSQWQVVKITEDGWHIDDNPPILFNRYRHQIPQIYPNQNGDINRILKYINIKHNHTLFLCWLVCCFVPDIPHAMAVFFGEKGAAKSTACSFLKKLIDPSALDTLTLQSSSRSLAVNLQQHWFLPFDNVSNISLETSDTLCRAITGGGIQQRRLHTNAEDYIFTFKRCLAINGINNVATRPDLLDRAILIELSRISEKDRRELSVVQAEFVVDLPYILGGVFDTLSKAIKIYPTVKLDKLPRMADFARWGFAIGEALGGYGEKFLNEYNTNQQYQNTEIINSDVVATLLIAFMRDKAEWTGMVSHLFNELSALASKYGINAKSKVFPSHPNVLSRRLNGLRSNLQAEDITYITANKSYGTSITINNGKISPLPPYEDILPDIIRKTNGDNMEIMSENGDNDDDIVNF